MYLGDKSKSAITLCVLFCCLVSQSAAWDSSELEIFDLVEEVNKNFYEVLGVPQDCSSADIRKAYRRLSLQLHPDKNDAPDAEVQFRQLVGIYEVLRDDAKRARYNQVLVEGLPSWRQPLYYYRRVRKMGMLELSVWLFVLTIIFQYAIAWGAYWEKKLTVEEFITSKLKKSQKKIKKKKQEDTLDVEEEIKQILVKPSYRNTLPFQLFAAIVALPNFYAEVKALIQQKRKEKQEKLERMKQQELEEEQLRIELEKEKERKAARRKRVVNLPDRTGEEPECLNPADEPVLSKTLEPSKPRITGPWTDEELADLAVLMKKYPTGTTERWEKIADALNRTVFEVTHFAKKVKENAYKPPGHDNDQGSQDNDEMVVEEKKKKEKTRGGKGATESDPSSKALDTAWSQKQQKSLEMALAQYPKGSLERWEKIAKVVPGKTKEECMLRVKQIAEMVKRKKQQEEEQSAQNEATTLEPNSGAVERTFGQDTEALE